MGVGHLVLFLSFQNLPTLKALGHNRKLTEIEETSRQRQFTFMESLENLALHVRGMWVHVLCQCTGVPSLLNLAR